MRPSRYRSRARSCAFAVTRSSPCEAKTRLAPLSITGAAIRTAHSRRSASRRRRRRRRRLARVRFRFGSSSSSSSFEAPPYALSALACCSLRFAPLLVSRRSRSSFASSSCRHSRSRPSRRPTRARGPSAISPAVRSWTQPLPSQNSTDLAAQSTTLTQRCVPTPLRVDGSTRQDTGQ